MRMRRSALCVVLVQEEPCVMMMMMMMIMTTRPRRMAYQPVLDAKRGWLVRSNGRVGVKCKYNEVRCKERQKEKEQTEYTVEKLHAND